jgi:hypothetical protein
VLGGSHGPMSWKRINRRQVQVFNGRGSEQREDDDKEDMCANIDYIYIVWVGWL